VSRPGKWDFDPDDDFLIVDGLEDVYVQRQRPDGTYENPYPVRAVREVPKRNTPVVLVDAVDITWHLHAMDWPFGAVLPGDRICDSVNVGWIVQEADLAGASDQWACRCVREVVRKAAQVVP
jgi:hypothetical protein